ncbi:Hypothetical predicted protein [Podarcis lilfordi]|uniref:Uncharacterized protein n=1 Tax=Podarcis lilfordi TaxID=74358 RepID=A0AA35PI36_9SAUR|nr:Hypothetical predicted protein [Podarcis lilfordi]
MERSHQTSCLVRSKTNYKLQTSDFSQMSKVLYTFPSVLQGGTLVNILKADTDEAFTATEAKNQTETNTSTYLPSETELWKYSTSPCF